MSSVADYRIDPWAFAAAALSSSEPALGDAVTVSASVQGDTAGLSYKYSYENLSTGEWRLIAAPSASASITWRPPSAGPFRVYVDVADSKGYKTRTVDCVVSEDWSLDSFTVSKQVAKVGETLTISAKTSGNNRALAYKFVWMRDSWADWGVIQQPAASPSVAWAPPAPGNYTLFVDVLHSTGVEEYSTTLEAYEGSWAFAAAALSSSEPALGDAVTVSASVQGDTAGLSYKYSYENLSTGEWRLIAAPSASASITWRPPSAGPFRVYVDVADSKGYKTRTVDCVVSEDWSLDSFTVSKQVAKVGETLTISAKTSGNNRALAYKFVWMRDSWADWGVIQQPAASPSVAWAPPAPGNYTLFVDVLHSTGVEEYSTTLEAYEGSWAFAAAALSSSEPALGDAVTVSASVQGDTAGLSYKYSYENLSTGEWRLIAAPSASASITWRPPSAGPFRVYVDVADSKGYKTRTVDCVVSEDWSLDSFTVSKQVAKVGETLTISAKTSGNNRALAYKFVWMRDSWADWGVIQQPAASPSVAWAPPAPGNYTLFVDVLHSTGVEEYSTTLEAYEGSWAFAAAALSSSEPALGDAVTVSASVQGDTAGLSYKYSYENLSTGEWRLIAAPSASASITWRPPSAGPFRVYVDVADSKGYKTRTVDCVVSEDWSLDSFTVSKQVAKVGETLTISAKTSGNNRALAYKFVWMRDSWADWGVIQQPAASPSVAWAPPAPGNYTLFVDVLHSTGVEEYSTTLEAYEGSWAFAAAALSSSEPALGDAVTVSASVQGDTAGLSYKYSYENLSTGEWRLIAAPSASASITWRPPSAGPFRVYVDVADSKGYKTRTVDCVVSEDWSLDSFTVSKQVAKVGETLTISAKTSGNNRALAYKFVWMRDSWADWGVIQQPAASPSVAWAPPAPGNYTLFVDVLHSTGVEEYSTTLEAYEGSWAFAAAALSSSEPALGDAVTVSASVQGDTAGLSYKYSYENLSTGEWRLIAAPSASASITWRPPSAGPFRVYVDVADSKGYKTRTVDCVVSEDWSLDSFTVSKQVAKVGETLTISAKTSGNNRALAYKFVWMRDSWADWGVIQQPAASPSVAWAPPAPGNYTLFVDVLHSTGVEEYSTTLVVGTPIMGDSKTTVDRMVLRYQETGHIYPATVYASKGAPSIRAFCELVFSEAQIEGVRAEVLFAQAMYETGWLQFGGSVKASQCNFGGLGAVDSQTGGAIFPDVKTGLLAQAQHLKAYASTNSLNAQCVDPRFSLVSPRGIAPCLEDLNGRWAVPGVGYGERIAAIANSL